MPPTTLGKMVPAGGNILPLGLQFQPAKMRTSHVETQPNRSGSLDETDPPNYGPTSLPGLPCHPWPNHRTPDNVGPSSITAYRPGPQIGYVSHQATMEPGHRLDKVPTAECLGPSGPCRGQWAPAGEASRSAHPSRSGRGPMRAVLFDSGPVFCVVEQTCTRA